MTLKLRAYMHAALTAYTVYTRSEIQYNLDSTTDRRARYSIRRCAPCKIEMESEHDLHIRAAAGEPAANLALCHDDRGCTYGIRQNDGGGVVSRGTCRSRSAVHCAHQCVLEQSCDFLEKCAGRLCACRLCLSVGIRLSDRRSERRTADRRSVSCADR